MGYALRHAYSDHSLYKPSINCFMQVWNEKANSPTEIDVQKLAMEYSHSLREKEMEQEMSCMSDSDRREYNRQVKRARRERRRNSVLISLQNELEEHAMTLPRASSTPNIRTTRLKNKRVAFSLEPLPLPLRYGDAVRPLPPLNRPILVKKRKVSCLPPSEVPHFDYETFAAWRRGSRMSLDVKMQEEILANQARIKAKLAAEKRRSLVSSLADVLKQCFIHRTARTSPVNWVHA